MMRKELKKMVEALEDQGFVTEETKGGHVRVFLDGVWVTTFAGTPSDRRSWLNSLAPAKRAGFRWPP
jgi:predicted RNA binding protein YcfA (HicA-like mRNA interferase family)